MIIENYHQPKNIKRDETTGQMNICHGIIKNEQQWQNQIIS